MEALEELQGVLAPEWGQVPEVGVVTEEMVVVVVAEVRAGQQ
jgi:hypothetical protein